MEHSTSYLSDSSSSSHGPLMSSLNGLDKDESDDEAGLPFRSSTSPSPSTTATSARSTERRHFIHIDVDCFYAQSAFIQLNPALFSPAPPSIPPPQPPIAVRQKHIIVTSNYPARSLGVGKLSSYVEATKKTAQGLIIVDGSDLTTFRLHSVKIYESMRSWLRGEGPRRANPRLEKKGMDEFLIQSDEKLDAEALKRAVYNSTCFTVSCGIGDNPMLAKIAAGLRKPNGVASLEGPGSEERLRQMPARVLPGLGRKALKALKVAAGGGEDTDLNVGDVRRLSIAEMVRAGVREKDARLFFDLSRGVDKREVVDEGGEESTKKKSSVEQSFRRGTILTLQGAKEQTRDVANRLLKLMKEENTRIGAGRERRPKRLIVTVRGRGDDGKSSYSVKRRSKSRPWPTGDKVWTSSCTTLEELWGEGDLTLINLAVEWEGGATEGQKVTKRKHEEVTRKVCY